VNKHVGNGDCSLTASV
jgi:hypothetical protein